MNGVLRLKREDFLSVPRYLRRQTAILAVALALSTAAFLGYSYNHNETPHERLAQGLLFQLVSLTLTCALISVFFLIKAAHDERDQRIGSRGRRSSSR